MMLEKNEKVKTLVIVGPTASGKSALAVRLAKKFNGEIISADSRQVYKGLDIGTGKITKREMEGVRHHLLDVVSPSRICSAHNFVVRAEKAIDEITRRGKIPIICGGTGFYIYALLRRVTLPDVPTNRALRARFQKKTAAELFVLLKKRNQRRAESMNASDRKNPRRLIRALEISYAKSANPQDAESEIANTLWLGMAWPQKKLRRRIPARLTVRMRRGMIAEARRLHARGLSYKRMESLGLEYRYLARFLQNKITRQEMLTDLEREIWHYAKRQLTYWKRNKGIKWFSPNNTKRITRVVQAFLSK